MDDQSKKKGKEVTRRDFIKGFGGGALGAAVAPRLLTAGATSVQTESGEVAVYSKKQVSLTVNGKPVSLVVEARETLLEVLRDRLDLTGAKKVCDRGECGGCTVLLDGKPVYACMYLAIRAHGSQVTTIEGLAAEGNLHPVQQAYIDKDGYQCGFCTPGFIMTTAAFLSRNPDPTRHQIQHALSGNLCRCGNYQKIYEAVEEAAKKVRGA
jgi:aerobic-type carbon monoxide dehydrogenase small subunit (CoxS/CutS family)